MCASSDLELWTVFLDAKFLKATSEMCTLSEHYTESLLCWSEKI